MIESDGSIEPRRLKVLIVEDEVLLAIDLERSLEELGQEPVGTADNATTALELAGRCAPDLALVDLNLRDGLTGPRIARHLADKLDVLVVLVTGSPEQIPPDFAGAVGAITKPCDAGTLGQLVVFASVYLAQESGAPLPAPPDSMKIAPSIR